MTPKHMEGIEVQSDIAFCLDRMEQKFEFLTNLYEVRVEQRKEKRKEKKHIWYVGQERRRIRKAI